MSIPPKMLLDYVGNRGLFSEKSTSGSTSISCSERKQTANGASVDIN